MSPGPQRRGHAAAVTTRSRSCDRGRAKQMTGRPHVVVVGAGFGGLAAARGLADADVEVTMVDRNNFHTFQPLLYQVATAGLSGVDVGHAVRAMFHRQANVRFRRAKVVGVDWDDRQVELADGGPLSFDYLVLAAGASTSYFGIDGAEEHALPLYGLTDAVARAAPRDARRLPQQDQRLRELGLELPHLGPGVPSHHRVPRPGAAAHTPVHVAPGERRSASCSQRRRRHRWPGDREPRPGGAGRTSRGPGGRPVPTCRVPERDGSRPERPRGEPRRRAPAWPAG